MMTSATSPCDYNQSPTSTMCAYLFQKQAWQMQLDQQVQVILQVQALG